MLAVVVFGFFNISFPLVLGFFFSPANLGQFSFMLAEASG